MRPVSAILIVQALILAALLYFSARLERALIVRAANEKASFEQLATVIRQTWYIHEQAIAEIEARDARQQPACQCLSH